jgi:hypothetical protein
VKTPAFASEADLCSAFIAWVAKNYPHLRCYAEWAGWDILLVYPEGWQIGIQAKMRLNAAVILQSAPDCWHDGTRGPDYRAILVPATNGWSEVAERLGLVVFWPRSDYYESQGLEFYPDLLRRRTERWIDWNPATRHELPPCSTDSIAGSSAPVTLTAWKLVALDVLADLAVGGSITAKRIRALGIDPGRWTTNCWLLPGDKSGDWVRGEKCPPFDMQHPTAFAAAMEKALERAKVPA